MQPLIDSLFALLLATPESALAERRQRVIRDSSEPLWQDALDALAPHKVFPLLSHQLARTGLWESVPSAARQRLKDMHDEVRARNAQLMLATARLLQRVAQRGESLLLLKGILLADSYYPDFSTRPMSDIDVVAVRGRDQVLFSIIEEAGFRPSLHHGVQEHSITFMNREGVFCDAHRRLPRFDAEPWRDLTHEIALCKVRGVRALALEPHAMVAHLVTHMHGHAPEMGFVLLWIVDLALVLRRHQRELAPAQVRRLMNDESAWALFLRLLRLLSSFGEPLEPSFSRALRVLPPLSLGAALRQRRITPWGLPGALGWVRLLAHELGLHRSDRPRPLASDLVLWPLDLAATKIASPLARLTQR